MPVDPKQFTDPRDREAVFYADLERRVRQLETRAVRVPILDADPTNAEPGNIYAFDDTRLMVVGSDGVIHQYVSTDDADAWPDVPVRSTDPVASTGIDLWVRGDQRKLCVRTPSGVWRVPFEGTGSSTESPAKTRKTSSDKPKQQQPTPKTYRSTFDATWGAAYCPTHGREGGDILEYGTFPGSAHGNRAVMIGFNDSAIRSFLGNGSIVKVEYHMVNTHAWWNDGVRIHLGGHNQSGKPDQFSQVRRNVSSRMWPKNGAGEYWRTIDDWFGRAFRDHDISGITIDQPAGTNGYGKMRWSSVRLRFTVRK